jgi:hypothetical protein
LIFLLLFASRQKVNKEQVSSHHETPGYLGMLCPAPSCVL